MEGSKKASKRNVILQAAAKVARESGVEHVTLDAVAQEAGVSKGGLLYHFPNKEELISGMVKQYSDDFVGSVRTRADKDPGEKGKWIKAYIETTHDSVQNENDMTIALSTALFTNPHLLGEMQAEYSLLQKSIEHDGLDPVVSTLFRLAADGLWFAEMFGFAPPDQALKEKVIRYILTEIEERK
ncbi:TetR/AcrR family transcriptional regulator [Paenibacillus macerans]|uniref:TetR/AcrR family transcriptional regulator n=1 Tax=Paenibacillus macerans TaxID=44252 RepID=UPI00204056D5|nr:TetR/AcrR family transcriptional regulator [Paenibacillus macerans]MCM3698906.1 TetR/AcrR family transcriptional regulator [Paenibacillus macerans]